jgi:hypothetical protein
VFLSIFLGYPLKARRLAADAFWAPAGKLTFYLFFPVLLVGIAGHLPPCDLVHRRYTARR